MNIKNRIKELKQVNWRELKELQPEDSKVIMNYGIVEKSIEKHGFAMPFFGWQDNDEIYIIDGHLRQSVLSNMENVPEKLPVVLIDAKDRKEAIEILIEAFNSKTNPFSYEALEQWIQVEEVDVAIETINVKVEDVILDEVEESQSEVKESFNLTIECEDLEDLNQVYNKLIELNFKVLRPKNL